MASSAISSQGTTITLDGNVISEITNWANVGVTADTTEVTNIDSPDNFDEHIKVIKRGGDISLDMNYTAATFVALDALVNDFATQTVDFVLTTTDAKVFTIPVIVISNNQSGSAADKISATVTLKVVGKPVITDVP